MNFGSCVKKVAAELNVGLKMCKFIGVFKPNCGGAVLDTPKSNDVPHLNQQLTSLSLCNGQTEKFCFISPKLDVAIKKSIIEPDNSIKINFELPLRNSTITELELPLHTEKEINEPGKVISKKAVHMMRVRKRKMRKHKRKKFLKKYATELYQRRLKKEMAKEQDFTNSLKKVLSEGENFSAEKYVDDLLQKYNWQRPVTHVRGRLAPQWVIKEHLQKQKERKILDERLKECLK